MFVDPFLFHTDLKAINPKPSGGGFSENTKRGGCVSGCKGSQSPQGHHEYFAFSHARSPTGSFSNEKRHQRFGSHGSDSSSGELQWANNPKVAAAEKPAYKLPVPKTGAGPSRPKGIGEKPAYKLPLPPKTGSGHSRTKGTGEKPAYKLPLPPKHGAGPSGTKKH